MCIELGLRCEMHSISKKQLMRKIIINIINIIKDNEPISRTDIKKVLGCRMASILEIVNELINIALSNTINLLNPEMVIFGGQMVKRTGYIMEPIKRVVKTSALQLASRDIIYETACFNEDGGALGAVAMVLDEYFEYTRLKNTGMLPEEMLNTI